MRFNKEILNSSGCASSPDPLATGDDLKACGGCLLCKMQLNKSTVFTSSVTKERFRFAAGGLGNACTTNNVVYLITCEYCKMQYVGETTNTLRTRFYGHRNAIKRGKYNTQLYYHFLDPGHRPEHCKVQIIYHYDKDDDDAKKVLLTVEEYYMRKLATVYPFGLNDKITSMNINVGTHDFRTFNSANTPFFSFPSERRKRSHGHRKKSFKTKESDSILNLIEAIFQNYKSNKFRIKFIRLNIYKLVWICPSPWS